MKKYLLAVAAIALVWISCTKSKEQDPVQPEITSRPLLRESYTAYDTVRLEYNADSTPHAFTYKNFYWPTDSRILYTATYDYSKSNEVTIWKKNANENNNIVFYKMEYANNKLVKAITGQPLFDYRDSLTYRPNGEIEKVCHISDNKLAYIDSLEWTNNNLTKMYRIIIGINGFSGIATYTYDDKPNPLRGLMEVTTHAASYSMYPRFYSVNNITGCNWYQPTDGYSTRDVMQLTYTDNKLVKRVTLGAPADKPLYSKDTVYYIYDKK